MVCGGGLLSAQVLQAFLVGAAFHAGCSMASWFGFCSPRRFCNGSWWVLGGVFVCRVRVATFFSRVLLFGQALPGLLVGCCFSGRLRQGSWWVVAFRAGFARWFLPLAQVLQRVLGLGRFLLFASVLRWF